MRKIFLFFAAILCAIGMNAKTLYLKPNSNWAGNSPRNAAYFYGNGNIWVGMTDTDGDGIYECEAPDGYPNVIFCSMNKNTTNLGWDDRWNQSADLTIPTDDKNLCTLASDWNNPNGTWSVYDPLATNVYLAGSMNGWSTTANEFRKANAGDANGTISMILEAGSYELKVVRNGTWTSHNGTFSSSVSGKTFSSSVSSNAKMNTTIHGEYTFTWAISSSQLSITYPTLCTITANANDVAMGSVTGAGEFGTGLTATLTAITNDGYVFVNWTKGGEIVSTDATYSFKVTEAVDLVANFEEAAEEVHNVTVSYLCNETTVKENGIVAVGVTTTQEVTAPTVTGYQFTNWTIGGGMTLTEGTATDATITVVTKSASSDYTLVANYKEVQETVYFINAGKWSKVHLHLWNGNAVGTEWPGTQLTATGEKIGEYDVYSYTAKQGDHLNLLFHENTGDVNKTTDLTWAEGVDKYYIHNYNSNTGWYTQSDAEELLVVPVVYETVYFVNNKNWSLVQIHAWNGSSNNGWPGQALTATGEKVEGFDVYSFEAAQGTYTNLIFNNKKGDAGEQSENYVWTADKYYYMGADSAYAGGTKEEVAVLVAPDPLATDVYLVGAMNGWSTTANEFRKATEDATTASVTVALSATTTDTCEFKLFIGGEWKGNNGTMQRGGVAVHESGWSFEEDGNCKIVADIAGDYTFTWDLTTKKLTVTYPELPKYTVTATAENGTIEGIENEGVYTQGATITLTATANDHYVFVNWTKGEDVVAETAEYTFTVEADVELVANFRHAASTINAHPNDGENGVLAWFISQAHAGDTVILADGEYIQEGSLTFDKPGLVIMAAENAKPVIKSGSYAQHYATTTIIGVTFDGKFSEEKQAEHGIYSYENTSKNLTLINCEFRNYENYLLTCSSSAHVDSLVIDGCLLHDCGDAAVYYQETDLENNVPTCSYFKMTNSTVYNINGTQYYAAIDIRENSAAYGQGGNKVIIDHVTIYNYATPLGAIRVYKSPDLAITNSIISNPTAVNYSLYIYGGTVDNTLYFNGAADSRGQYTNCLNVDPLFVDADNGNFELMPLSPARGAATDGGDLGDPRWYTSVTKYTVTATANPAEAGTVTGAGEYTEGKEVTLVATPAYGYNFVNWTKGEEVVAETAEYTFTASANVELVANFEEKAFTGNIINVEPGEGTLATAVENAEAGDKLVLADGTYTQEYSINMDKAGLIITAAENAKPVIQLTGEWTTLNVSASTTFEGITFDANNVAKYIIATLDSVAMTTDLVIYNCEFKNWTLWAVSNQYANNVSVRSVVIDNCLFHDATGAAISFSNYAPEGKQACEYFEMTNSTLYKISESSYRGIINVGSNPEAEGDYNTVVIDHITMYDYTLINSGIAAIAIRKTHNLRISNSIIANPEDNGYTALNVYGGTVDNTIHYNGAKRSGSTVYTNCYNTDPMFTNAEHGIFCLQEGSPAIGAATDGSNLGDPRWVLKPVVTHTVTATAENGTVTGAGTYNHGEEVTLTATPAFDYQFVKWSNESTENPLTITVEDNIELQAIFAEVAATEKKESGVFSISAHKTATFATGNLQYNVGTDTWRFAKQQYQVVGEQNINLGDPAFTGWIDMLGWSNGDANNYGVNPSNVNELYDGEFVDWGTKMGEGWSTLSAEEWSYLLNTRENAASLKQTAKVDTILGLLLFPDGWVMPEDVVVEAEMDEYFEVNIYNYTLEQWTKLEQAGAIFLPAAGRRTGGYGNMINYDQQVETREDYLVNGGFYRWQDNTNIYCYYWTSTINEDKNVSYLHNVLALGNDEYTIGNGAIWGEKGRYGQSVRLAKVAYDKHTVTATAENGTVTGAGEYTHGTEITLTAIPAEHYVFVNWTNGEEVVAETAEYTFTVEADVELVANFKLDSHTVAATAENGTVTGLVEGGKYEHGATATLTATAAEGYEFVNWTAGKDTVSTEATYTFTVEADVNLVANFQEVIPAITYTVKWYTAVGETTEVTLEKGADITKPATDPEMEGYVFMGWTDECFVAEDGSDFTAIEEFGTADADKEYYAVFAVETTTDGGVTETLTGSSLSYAGNNGYVDFTATTTSGTWSGKACYNTNNYIQINKNKNNYHIGSPTFAANIKSIKITTTNNTASSRKFYICSSNSTAQPSSGDLGSHTTTASNEQFTIELTSDVKQFYIYSSGAVYISQIDVTLSGEPTTTYSNYMTTCTPEEYTIEWSVNGEVTETTTVVEGDALVLPEAPAAPDACSEKVFMGWATTATVNAYGTEITFVDETTVPEGDATYYAVFATEIEEETNETYTKTATVSIADYAAANSWGNDTQYTQVIIDKNITATAATATGTGNTGKYYNSGYNWRFYQTDEDATLTINAAEGVTINNVTVTYASSNSGVLTFNSNNIQSGTPVEVNASSVTFGVGNTGTATNGQVRVTQISVNYTFSGTVTSTTYADYATTCEIPEYTVTFDYSVDAGYITVNDVRISEKEVTYKKGTVLTVKALTFNNYRFDAWMDEEAENELSITPEYTFTVTADVVLKASITYVSGAVGTGVENNNVVSSKTMKVIQNGRLMIIREGKTYNAQGQMIE